MIRLSLVLTLMLTVIGLPLALEPFLFQSKPRLVILNTEETPHVINPDVRNPLETRLQVAEEPVLTPLSELDGPQLSLHRPFADELIAADS
ncbi:MAG: hypothetical protein ACPHXW_04260 [Marinobacterium sp.]